MSQLIYFKEAKADKYFEYLYIAGAFAIIFYCLANIRQNPIVISLIILIFLFFICIAGYDQIRVYTDRVEFKIKHPIEKLSKVRVFKFDHVLEIHASMRLTRSRFLLLEFLSISRPTVTLFNTLSVKFKNNEQETVDLKMLKPDVLKILDIIKHQSLEKIKIVVFEESSVI